ncbi:MAG: tetratricopeptide repeat protein, partial [Planctomycetes bacterium]|nr:tetratricopeptide repeat protein [Planctomycetota bacterium]
MRAPFVLLKFVAKSALNAVGFGVAGDFAMEVLPQMSRDIWGGWAKDRNEAERKADVQALVEAPSDEVKQQVKEVVRVVAGDKPADVQLQLETYLNQVPSVARQSLRRRDDPRGRTIPPGMSLQRPDDLLPFLPPRLPRFKPGDAPLRGVDWRLERLLGAGGFGEVWKAVNPHVGGVPPVALKFCLDPSARERLLHHEANILGQVMRQTGGQSGIVRLLRTYLSAEPPCLEYEFIDGNDLAGLLFSQLQKDPAGIPPSTATQIILKLARTVAFAHGLKPAIVHRDLKPANILCQRLEDGKVRFRITDFGIGGVAADTAIEQTRASQSGYLQATAVRGAYSPLYASPQQMRGELPDPRDDVYALGVIWYQLLTGDLTSGAPAGSGWRRALSARGVTSSTLDLMEQCFETDPGERLPDAAVLAKRIHELFQAKPADTSTAGTTSAPQREPEARQENGAKREAERGQEGIGQATQTEAGTRPAATHEGQPAEQVTPPRDSDTLTVAEHCKQGDAYFEQRRFREAVTAYSAALKLDADLPAAYEKRSRAYAALGKYPKALADAAELIRRFPSSPAGYIRQAELRLDMGDLDKATRDFGKAIQLDPRCVAGYVGRGRAHTAKQVFELALADFDAALRLDPACAEAYFQRADCRFEQDENDAALADYNEAIRLQPANAEFHLHLGWLYDSREEHDRAISCLTEALRLRPDSELVYRARGLAYAGKDNYEQAVADYTRAIELNRSFTEAYVGRGIAYGCLGRHGKAISDFSRAIKLDPKNAVAYLGRGEAHLYRGEYAEAISDFTKALKTDRDWTDALLLRGDTYTEAGEFAKAVADYTKAISQDPQSAAAYASRARVHGFQGEHDAALADASEALRLEPDNSLALVVKGEAHLGRGEWDTALADFTAGLGKAPDDPELLTNRGLAYFNRGDADLAIADLTRAIQLAPRFGAAYAARATVREWKGDLAGAEDDRKKAIKLDPSLDPAACGRPRKAKVAGVTEEPENSATGPDKSDTVPRRKRGRKSPVGRGVTLADIISAGLLVPPVKLFRKYKGHMLEATLLSDGSVEFQQQRYATCSAAAEAARATVSGRQMNTNGWTFWRYREADGKKRRLRDARQRAASTRKDKKPANDPAQVPNAEESCPEGGSDTRRETIRNKALELLSARPDGIRYAELVREIHRTFPDILLNTIHGNVWNLDKVFPADIYKPARGVFKAVKFREAEAVGEKDRPERRRLRDEMLGDSNRGLSVEEIAGLTGYAINTVRTYLSTGRR